MSIVLDLPSELESELTAEASRAGVSVSEYALWMLRAARTLLSTPQTGAELVEFWRKEGLVGTRPDILDALSHARKLREQAQIRFRQ